MEMEAPERNFLTWRVSTMSVGGNCVEVAAAGDGVAVRNSRRPDAEVIFYTKAEFQAFLGGVKNGEFDDLIE